MSIVGSAYVIVRAISSALEGDFKDAVERAAQAAAPAAKAAGTKMAAEMGDSISDASKKAARKAAPAAEKAGEEIGEGLSRGAGRSMAGRMASHIGGALRLAVNGGGKDADKHGQALGGRMMNGFAKSVHKFKIPPMVMLGFLGIPAIGGALTAVAAYAAGAVSLISTLGPALAAVGSVGLAGILSVGGVAAAVMLALKTASPMLDRFKIASGAVGDQFKEIGLSVQGALLPPLAQGLGQLTEMIPTLRVGLTGIGAAVGGVATKLAETATSARFMSNLGTTLENAAPATTHFGGALGHVLDMVVTLGAAASPLLVQFSKWTESVLGSAAASLQAAQESGRLAAFLDRASAMASSWGGIIGDLATGLFNVFKAAGGSGKEFLDGLGTMMAKFSVWSGSLEGQNSLKAFFDNAVPVVREINGLIGDVIKLIGQPLATGDTGGIITFIQSLRTDIIPALEEIGAAASGLGPGLTDLATSVAGLISSMAESGALGAFVDTLNLLIQGLTALFQIPIVGDLAGWALAFGGAAKAVDLVLSPIGGLEKVTGPLSRALFGVAGDAEGLGAKAGLLTPAIDKAKEAMGDLATKAKDAVVDKAGEAMSKYGKAALDAAGNAAKATGSFIAQKAAIAGGAIASAAAATATGIQTAAQWALNAAMAVNPIVWIVIAIAALVAGLVLAYNKSETFRNIVNAVGEAIKNGLGAALEWLKGLWDKIWPVLVSGWEGIKSAFSAGVDFVKRMIDKFRPVIDAITQPFQGLVQIVKGVWQVISGIFTGDGNKILDGIANIFGGIVRIVFGLPARILGFLVGLWPTIVEFFTGMWTAVSNAFMSGVDSAIAWVSALPGRIGAYLSELWTSFTTWATATWTDVTTAFSVGIEAAMAWIAALPDRIGAYLTLLWTNFTTWASDLWASVSAAFSAGVEAAIAWVSALPGRVMSAASSLWSSFTSWASNLWTSVSTSFSNGVDSAVAWVSALPGRIVSAVGNLGNTLYQAGSDLIDGMKRGLTNAMDRLMSSARELAGKVAGAVKSALGIASPSKVFMEIGRNTGEGMALGIDSMTRAVSASGAGLARAAVPSPGDWGPGSARGGPGGGATYGDIYVNMSIDDVDKMSKLSDFLDMIASARVQSRKTQRSGTVTA